MINKGFNNRISPLIKSDQVPRTNTQNNNQAGTQIKLSLCMIVKNEAKRIADCLKSVGDFADEIVIVDTGSSDRTIAIAKKFDAKIFNFEWCDDFAAARNYALAQAAGEWVLVLDADEVLEPKIMPILREVMTHSEYLAVNLNRAETNAKLSPYSLIARLFRRHPELYFTGFYHESIDKSVEILQTKTGLKVVTIPAVAIHHYGYRFGDSELERKRDFAQKLMEKQLTAEPNDAYTHSKLGALFTEAGNINQGLALLQAGLNLVNPRELPTLFELNYHLGIAFSKLENWELAIFHYQKALDLDVPDLTRLPALNNLGNIFQAQGNFAAAIICYEKIIEIAPDFVTAYFNLGIARKAVYDFAGAIDAYVKALEINPQYAAAYQNLGVALQQTGRLEPSKMAFTEAIRYYKLQKNPQNAAIIAQLQDHLQSLI